MDKKNSGKLGGYSQVRAEMILLRTSSKRVHGYYHLISGADLPIKSQDEIHSFFLSNPQQEYVDFQLNATSEWWIDRRLREYYFFQDSIIGGKKDGDKKTGFMASVFYRLNDYSLIIQKKLKINRGKWIKKKIYKGGNWFSITHDMARFILSREKEIKKMFKYGICVDELFVQTIVMDSPFRDRVNYDIKRKIDWERGQPYTWRIQDYNELMSSEALWARKFDEQVDREIIDAIYEKLMHC